MATKRIRAGEAVAWRSQSAGTSKLKRGTVLAFIPARTRVREVWSGYDDLPSGRNRLGGVQSQQPRYLVEVPRGNGLEPYVYAPAASTVEEQNPLSAREP